MLNVAGVVVKARRATGARADCKDTMAGVIRRADCENIMTVISRWLWVYSVQWRNGQGDVEPRSPF